MKGRRWIYPSLDRRRALAQLAAHPSRDSIRFHRERTDGPLSPFLFFPLSSSRNRPRWSMASISVETKYFPSSGVSSPALALQVTCLVDSYMLWMGVTEELEENSNRATLQGHFGKDWAVSMPPWKVRTSWNEGSNRGTLFLHCITRHCQQREASCCGRRARTWPFR